MSRRQFHHLLRLIAVLILCAAFISTPARAVSSLDLVVHYVEGIPAADQEAYDVKAYLSVLDEAGNAVKDLELEDVSVTEDSQTVEIETLAVVSNEPVSVVLVLNTSQAMRGSPIEAVRTATTSFVASLDANDQVAMLTYNDEIETVSDFTTDHQDVQDEIGRLDSVSGSGACLYDAIYQAVQMTAGLTSGQRAVIVLTNGEDRTTAGEDCSSMTVEDVIEAASEGGMRVPIYTVGLGTQVDEQELERVSQLSGGRYHYAEDNDALDPLFLRIATQFNSQYVLGYTSYAPAGAHTLAVKVDYSKAQDQDTRGYILPPFPTRVTITAPVENQEVGGMTTVTANVSGGGEPVSDLVLEINGESVITDSATPYELAVDFNNYPEGNLTIEVIARGADGTELARDSQSMVVSYASAEGDGDEEGFSLGTLGTIALIAGAGFLGILVLIIFLVMRSKNKKKKKSTSRSIPQNWTQNQTLGEVRVAPPAPKPAASTPMSSPQGNSDATMVDVPASAAIKAAEVHPAGTETLGSLTVEFCDDGSMIGHRFDIMRPQTTIGRSADNDINFPKDSPISRRHALIEARREGMFLSEVQARDESGTMKSPTFGTFVNEAPLPAGGAVLRNGDIIRLGKRVKLKFETNRNLPQATPPAAPDLDKTIAS